MDLVTGGTGFVGSHVIRALLQSRRSVRCLVRSTSPRRNVEGLPVELVEGDLRDPASLGAALQGIDVVYHCAADYRLWTRDPRELYRTNVAGTENLLKAAADAGARRVVYTSSVGALGLTADGIPADETTPVRAEAVVGHYKRSKYEAERVALGWAARGFPVVIVNPSTPIGEGEVRPTPTGQIIVDFLNGRMPAYVDTGLNVIDVRDVAVGHLLAAEKGRPGERYILGHSNMTLLELLELIGRLTGRPAPRLRLPHAVPLAVAAVDTALARLRRRPPRVSLEAVRMSRHRMYFDASKAVGELGLPQSPIEAAAARAVAWFRDNGYVKGPLAAGPFPTTAAARG
jgi:dihydroflavonol-4-reductase